MLAGKNTVKILRFGVLSKAPRLGIREHLLPYFISHIDRAFPDESADSLSGMHSTARPTNLEVLRLCIRESFAEDTTASWHIYNDEKPTFFLQFHLEQNRAPGIRCWRRPEPTPVAQSLGGIVHSKVIRTPCLFPRQPLAFVYLIRFNLVPHVQKRSHRRYRRDLRIHQVRVQHIQGS